MFREVMRKQSGFLAAEGYGPATALVVGTNDTEDWRLAQQETWPRSANPWRILDIRNVAVEPACFATEHRVFR